MPAVLILAVLGGLIGLWLVVEPRVRKRIDTRKMIRTEATHGIAQLERMLAKHAAAAERRSQQKPSPRATDQKS